MAVTLQSQVNSSENQSIFLSGEELLQMMRKRNYQGSPLESDRYGLFLDGEDDEDDCSRDESQDQEESVHEEEVVTEELYELYLVQQATRMHLSSIAMAMAKDSSRKADLLKSCACNKPFCSALCLLEDSSSSSMDTDTMICSPSLSFASPPSPEANFTSPKRDFANKNLVLGKNDEQLDATSLGSLSFDDSVGVELIVSEGFTNP